MEYEDGDELNFLTFHEDLRRDRCSDAERAVGGMMRDTAWENEKHVRFCTLPMLYSFFFNLSVRVHNRDVHLSLRFTRL